MTDMITRCPACETSFRITEAQLKTARGAVRCGSCLQIFRAADNLVQRRRETAQARGKGAGKAAPRPGRGPMEADSVPTSPKWYLDDEETGEQASTESRLRFNQSAIDTSEQPATEAAEDDLLISDDMALMDEQSPSSPAVVGEDLNEPFLDLDAWQPGEKSLFDRDIKPKTGEDEAQEEADESWALELLEEDDDEPANTHSRERSSRPEQESFAEFENAEPGSKVKDHSRTSHFENRPDHESADYSVEIPLSATRDDEDYGIAEDPYDYDDDRRELLSRIEPEPVEFAFHQGSNWRKNLLWGSLSALGLILLAAQVAWLQFDTLSRKQPYRDLYAMVCPYAGCQLPSLAAPDKIRTSNLVVRSHPQAEGALMVDTILLNTASHAQPFPDLILSFSNIHGETLAARRFTPPEYLAGELAGRTEMPSNRPVHLTLEIVDPGPDAVNYSAYIPGTR